MLNFNVFTAENNGITSEITSEISRLPQRLNNLIVHTKYILNNLIAHNNSVILKITGNCYMYETLNFQIK